MSLGPLLMLWICSLSVLVLNETLLVSVLETVRQCYRRRRMDLAVGLYRCLLGIMRMDRVPNARIMEMCGVTKWLEEMIEESVRP